MRVQGHGEEISVAEYRTRLGARLTELLDAADDAVLPDPDDVARAAVDLMTASDGAGELGAAVGPFWSAAKVRTELGSPSRQALESRRTNGTLLAVRTSDGVLVYPVAQFERVDGRVRVRPALAPILSMLRASDAWAVGLLLVTPATELGDLSPLDWARQGGDAGAVATLARNVHREWAAGSGPDAA